MWVLLSKISRAKPHGIKKTPESWKFVMLHECKHECQFEIGLDGKPFEVGLSTSNLKVDQMSELIEYIYWFGAEYGVDLSDTRKAA